MLYDFAGYHSCLVATDFSTSACAALKQAVWLSRQTEMKITLAHTLPNIERVIHSVSAKAKLDLLEGDGTILEAELRENSNFKMQEMLIKIGEPHLNVQSKLLLGKPFLELTHVVQCDGNDLVLCGTRGLTGWEQFFVGSTAKRLIRKCPANVWAVKPNHSGPPKVVVAATDFSDVSFKAVKQSHWIAKKAGASFHLLHVVDSMDIPEEVVAKIPEGKVLRNELNAEAASRLESLAASLEGTHANMHLHVTWGTPWKETSSLAKQLLADLIAIGTIGRTGIRGVLLGNTAEKILDTCDCSILTTKPDDFISPITPEYSSAI